MDNIQSNAKNVFDKLNTESNRNFIQKLFDSIGNFFKNLFGWINTTQKRLTNLIRQAFYVYLVVAFTATVSAWTDWPILLNFM